VVTHCNSIFHAIERLDDDVRNMPHNYVSKDDYKGTYEYDRLVALIDTAKQNNHGFFGQSLLTIRCVRQVKKAFQTM